MDVEERAEAQGFPFFAPLLDHPRDQYPSPLTVIYLTTFSALSVGAIEKAVGLLLASFSINAPAQAKIALIFAGLKREIPAADLRNHQQRQVRGQSSIRCACAA
jgi:hypothetical protein